MAGSKTLRDHELELWRFVRGRHCGGGTAGPLKLWWLVVGSMYWEIHVTPNGFLMDIRIPQVQSIADGLEQRSTDKNANKKRRCSMECRVVPTRIADGLEQRSTH